MVQPPLVAYFSMEIGLESGMPTYSGGLGVLGGDTIRSAADLDVPLVAARDCIDRGVFQYTAHGRTVPPRCLSIGATGCDAAPRIDVRAL